MSEGAEPSNDALAAVVALQRALGEASRAEARLLGIPDWMRELHAEHTAKSDEIGSIAEEATTALVTRRAAEAAIADSQEKLKHYQQQIGLVRTQREYAALLQEIDTVKGQIKALEEQAIDAMSANEAAQERLAEERAAFVTLQARYDEELAKWEAEKPSVAAALDEAKAQVQTLRARVAPPVLAQFQRLMERYKGHALASLRKTDRGPRGAPVVWSCTACNYRVRPQVVLEIRNGGAIVECDGCRRILYLADGV